jgi:hypothetical protein
VGKVRKGKVRMDGERLINDYYAAVTKESEVLVWSYTVQ